MAKGAGGQQEKHGRQRRHMKPKPIDINKKFLIIKSDADLEKLITKDNISNEDITELKNSFEKNDVKGEKKKRTIVIPRFKICENSNSYNLEKFEKPKHYIRYELYNDQVSGIKLSDGSIVHYDLLEEDENFLNSLNVHLNKPVTEDDFCKLVDKFEKMTGTSDNKEEINIKDAFKAAVELKINLKSTVIKDIYNYWKAKRKKLGRPLLRMFWNYSQNILPNHSVFRSRVKEKMTLRKHKRKNSEVIIKMRELLEDFKRLDVILKKMQQRDEKKIQLLQLNAILFDQRKNEIEDKSYVCPMWNYYQNYNIEEEICKKGRENSVMSLNSNNSMCITNVDNNDILLSDELEINKKNKNLKKNDFTKTIKINPNDFKNVVLIKRRGRNHRIWVDRKYVNDSNSENIQCCDLTYTFNDIENSPLTLNQNYQPNINKSPTFRQKINQPLSGKMVTIKDMDVEKVNDPTNTSIAPTGISVNNTTKSATAATATTTFTVNKSILNKKGSNKRQVNNEEFNAVALEQGEQLQNENKKKRRKKKETNDNIYLDNISMKNENNVYKEEFKKGLLTPSVIQHTNTTMNTPINIKNEETSSICQPGYIIGQTEDNENLKTKEATTQDELSSFFVNGVPNINNKVRIVANGESKDVNQIYPNICNNTLSKTRTSVTNIPDIKTVCNQMKKQNRTKNSFAYNLQKSNKTIFQFEDLLDPQINKHNYPFCLSKYACIQKRILFYLENTLNFENYNFKNKKGEAVTQSSQNVPTKEPNKKVTASKSSKKGKLVQ
ncbi:conserved protein, unknown function [Hepatocystis sp. ex Piliocolobus tephrosceles]|nr:conserved protein, unknown function [Hepatocystis sp. ex Piliocolobus tephrosceles]